MVGGINSLLSSYYTQANSQVNSTSQIYDYKAAQQQTKQWVEEYKANNTQVQALKKDSADFLQQYTGSMNTLATAANKLAGGGVDKLLTGRDGQVTDETIKATVDAAQKMVDAHNSSVKLLNDNADRGAGVVNQLARMVGDPAASAGMAMVGMKMNDDGTLALDIEKMTAALKSETPGDTDLSWARTTLWRAVVAAALDTRIKLSIPVAGSAPLYVRNADKHSRGDAEQVYSPLFDENIAEDGTGGGKVDGRHARSNGEDGLLGTLRRANGHIRTREFDLRGKRVVAGEDPDCSTGIGERVCVEDVVRRGFDLEIESSTLETRTSVNYRHESD